MVLTEEGPTCATESSEGRLYAFFSEVQASTPSTVFLKNHLLIAADVCGCSLNHELSTYLLILLNGMWEHSIDHVPKYNTSRIVVFFRDADALLLRYDISVDFVFQIGSILVCWLRENKDMVTIFVVYLKMIEIKCKSQ